MGNDADKVRLKLVQFFFLLQRQAQLRLRALAHGDIKNDPDHQAVFARRQARHPHFTGYLRSRGVEMRPFKNG